MKNARANHRRDIRDQDINNELEYLRWRTGEEATSNVELSDDTPLKHSRAGDDGSGALGSKSDHSHPGVPYYEATTKSTLATPTEDIAEAWTTTSKLWFDWDDVAGAWRLRGGQRVANEAALTITGLDANDDGATIYAESEDTLWMRHKANWRQLIRWHSGSTSDGPCFYESSNKLYYVNAAGTSFLISHWS